MKATLSMAAVVSLFCCALQARAEDPFAAGEDALAVKEDDGSASVRARLKVAKMEDDMVLIRVASVDDKKFPNCLLKGTVLKTATSKAKHFKLMGRGKTYTFLPVYKKRGRSIDLNDKVTQANLGACFYPAKTKLVIKVGGVDLKAKAFKATTIYLQ
ncbi:MAG: hypothetical protein H6707_03470 [Deltaproteobacteria bacterium]|nr:hypothetical protein [Deltaproteobacteria bacterium]